MLLVLDNFEHLLGGAWIIGDLLTTCPGLTILVTSRIRLRVAGEHHFPVLPLALPTLDRCAGNFIDQAPSASAQIHDVAAIRLFVERAHAVDPTFVLTDANALTVAAICQRLDGVPLALELAAARGRLLSPAAVLARLDISLGLLIGGAPDAPPRLQSVRGAIDWSYDLLTPVERTLFRRLSVFVGGCTVDAAEAIAGGEEIEGAKDRAAFSATLPGPSASQTLDVLDTLASLVDQSLIQRLPTADSEPRLSMLETIREFGLEQLSAHDETEAVRRTHAAFYVRFAEEAKPQMFRGDQVRWMDRLDAEHDNLRVALTWAIGQGDAALAQRLCVATAPLWLRRCHFREGRYWVEQALSLEGPVPPPVRVYIYFIAGALADALSDLSTAMAMGRAAVTAATTTGDVIDRAVAHMLLGSALLDSGDLDGAHASYAQCLADFRLENDPRTSDPIGGLALIAWLRGDQAGFIVRAKEQLDVARAAENAWSIARALANAAEAARLSGDQQRGIILGQESLAVAWGIRDLVAVAAALLQLAAIAHDDHHYATAARLFGAAERQREASGVTELSGVVARSTRVANAVAVIRADAALAAAWEAGRTLSPEAAVAAGLDLPDVGTGRATITSPARRVENLTRRETEVLKLIATGWTDRQIAEALFISSRTASHHVEGILAKLNVDTRTAAATVAVRLGLV